MTARSFELRRTIAPLVVLGVGTMLAAVTASTRFEGLSHLLMLVTAAATIIVGILAFRRGDLATILTAGRDERQALVAIRAAAAAGVATMVLCLGMACRQLLQREGHNPGPYLAIVAVFTVVYVVAAIAGQKRV